MAEDTIILATELKKKLQEGWVTFTFKKKDGTQRIAIGTTKLDLIPEGRKPVEKESIEGQSSESKEGAVQVYYDIEKNAWRSFQKASLLSVVPV